MKSVFLFLLISLVAGCTHLNSVSTSQVPKDRSKPVAAEGYRFIFLLFNFSNSYVDNMVADLANQCPNGKVQGILTKQESITYFPLIAHANRVTATGYCVAAHNVEVKEKMKR